MFSTRYSILSVAYAAVLVSATNPTVTVPVTTTETHTVTLPPSTVTTTVTTSAPSSTITAGPSNQCNTGSLQCCNSVQQSNSAGIAGLLGLLGVVVSSVTSLVGVTCSPLTIIGGGGNSCTAQPVCCTNNTFSGIIALGCTPININL